MLEIKRAIAVHKDDADLANRPNASVKILLSSARYKQIQDKCYGKPGQPLIRKTPVVRFAIILGTTVLILLMWRYVSVFKVNKQLKKPAERSQTSPSAKTGIHR